MAPITAGIATVAIWEMAGFTISHAWNNLSFRSRATAITLSIAGLFSSIFALIFSKAVIPVSRKKINASVAFVRISSKAGFAWLKAAIAFFAKFSAAGTTVL